MDRTLSPKSRTTDVPAESTPLWRHLQLEDYPSVEFCVKKEHASVNIQDSSFGWTPVHFLCNTGNGPLLKLLLEFKAKPGLSDNEGNTPLMLASRRGHVSVVEYLIGNGVGLDGQNKNGWTAFIWAALSGHEEVATALMSASSDYSATDNTGRSAIMWAARHGHLGIVESILANGINLGIEDDAGLTVMDHAQEHETMRSVIAAVVELNEELLPAVKRGDKEEVALLLQSGANVELRDEEGWTPLMWAVLQKSVDLVEVIMRHGANPSLLDEKGKSMEQLGAPVGEALHTILGSNHRMLTAARDGDWDAVEEELRLGAFINTRDEAKRNCLMHAARNAAPEAMSMLVNKNCLLNERDPFGWAAVHHAVETHDLDSVAMLWYLGADFGLRTAEEDSLLHIAVRGDDAPMIQLLLASQAKLEDLNFEGYSPLMVAASNSLPQSIHTLLAYKASISVTDGCKRTPFAIAVVKGNMKAITAFMEPQGPPKLLPEGKKGRPRLRKSGTKTPSPKRASQRKSVLVAGGVAKRKKVAPTATAEKRGEDEKALIEAAVAARSDMGGQKPADNRAEYLSQLDCDGRAPLALAIGNMQIFQRLIEEQADVAACDAAGNTVLMEAVAQKQRDAVARLLEEGVDARAANNKGKTAYDICEDPYIKQMLDRYAIAKRLPDLGGGAAVEEVVEQRPSSKASRGFRVRMEQLPTKLTDELLEEAIRLFLKQRGAASVVKMDIALDPITARPRGYAYVDFLDAACADLAVRGDGLKINGQVVRIVRESH